MRKSRFHRNFVFCGQNFVVEIFLTHLPFSAFYGSVEDWLCLLPSATACLAGSSQDHYADRFELAASHFVAACLACTHLAGRGANPGARCATPMRRQAPAHGGYTPQGKRLCWNPAPTESDPGGETRTHPSMPRPQKLGPRELPPGPSPVAKPRSEAPKLSPVAKSPEAIKAL